MSLFCANRLAIGTANWGKEYNGVKVPESEQEKILGFCREVGIDMIDTATAYGTADIEIPRTMQKVVKVNCQDSIDSIASFVEEKPYCIMSHDDMATFELVHKLAKTKTRTGESLYPDTTRLNGLLYDLRVDVVQIPYSLFDRRFAYALPQFKLEGKEVHVRSVFLRGKILERATPHECISFCLMNPNVDRVILGVDSLGQLQDNLAGLIKMDSLKVEDEKVLDPRQW